MYINWPYGGLLKKAISGVPARLSHVAFAVASVSRYYYSDRGRTVLQRLYGPWTAAALFLRPCTESSTHAILWSFRLESRQENLAIYDPNFKMGLLFIIKLWLLINSSWTYIKCFGYTNGPWTAATLFLRQCTESLPLPLMCSFSLEYIRPQTRSLGNGRLISMSQTKVNR